MWWEISISIPIPISWLLSTTTWTILLSSSPLSNPPQTWSLASHLIISKPQIHINSHYAALHLKMKTILKSLKSSPSSLRGRPRTPRATIIYTGLAKSLITWILLLEQGLESLMIFSPVNSSVETVRIYIYYINYLDKWIKFSDPRSIFFLVQLYTHMYC